MPHRRFSLGDRIVTYNPRFNPAGATGTIVLVYQSVADCYDVQLDGATKPCILYDADLAAAPIMEWSVGLAYDQRTP